jgi:hypothetical protein
MGTHTETARNLSELPDPQLDSIQADVDGLIARGRKLLDHKLGIEPQCWPSDNEARLFVADCARQLEHFLEGQSKALSGDDSHLARIYCEQARRIAATQREIQTSWPWSDVEACEASRRQYERGVLMDFETFKHELLKAAQ